MRNFTCDLTSRLFNLQLVTFLTSKVSALHINVKLKQCFFFAVIKDTPVQNSKFLPVKNS